MAEAAAREKVKVPAASRDELVAAYKRLLQEYIDRRPSGLRLKIARAIGKHRSFVSQITNPIYPIPVPARHLEAIFRICHLAPEEKQAFLAAPGFFALDSAAARAWFPWHRANRVAWQNA